MLYPKITSNKYNSISSNTVVNISNNVELQDGIYIICDKLTCSTHPIYKGLTGKLCVFGSKLLFMKGTLLDGYDSIPTQDLIEFNVDAGIIPISSNFIIDAMLQL